MLFARLSLRLALLLALSGVVVMPLQAQISVKATPYSFRVNLGDAPPTFPRSSERLQMQAQQSSQQDEQGFFIVPPDQHGVETLVDLGFENAGQWTSLPDGERLWQLRIISEGASSLNLIYDEFWMPPGAQLFLYNEDGSVVLGAFTEQNNKAYGGFATDILPGETTILEYYEPAGVTEPGRLHVSTVVHGLLHGEDQASTASGPYMPTSLSCSINTACSEGQGWENEVNATVKIVIGGSSCTGVLLNNMRDDGTPYVLTANHCGGYPTPDQQVNWVFQFNYQSATCADPAETPSYQSITGAVVRAAQAGDGDFTLLELSAPIPASFNAYFAGWSVENVAPSSGVVIGHPTGDIKKITLDDDSIPTSYIDSDFWLAAFDHGTIEGSSSGAPLFNEQHEFVGHVRSAIYINNSACSGPGGDDNEAQIHFPKLASIWNLGSPDQRPSDFLDPDGTGVTSQPGTGAEPPSAIWINEIDAHATSGLQDDEFVEIVGPPGTDLAGYTINIYSCSGGTATLQSTETIGAITLLNDYQEFGVYVIAGPSPNVSNVDQIFNGSGLDVLPDGSGLLVLKDDTGTELFDYQYDTETGGTPDNCPSARTTRSAADPSGDGTMGFVISNPAASTAGTAVLTASPGTQNSDGGQLLPVELVSFHAVLDGNAVLLRWETASETNNAGFEVQLRDHAKRKAAEWQGLGFVDGHGTTLEAQTYQYRVEDLAAGRYRFRLKQIDYDGAFEYSPEVEVAVKLPKTHHVSKAYPNPFNPQTQFSVSVARAQWVDVSIFDLLGRRVATLFEGQMEAQSSRAITFEATNLPSGVYLVRVAGKQFVESQTITLMK